MENWIKYFGLSIVFFASIISATFVPVSEFISGMIALPGVAALCGALFQIARDSAAFEKQKHLQSDQQVFILGASSHMATIAFDKHVEFCEAYMSEVDQTIGILFREGPTPHATDCAARLFSLKRKYSAWIPKSVSLKLEPFENALNKIGNNAHLMDALRDKENSKARNEAVDEAFEVFSNVLGMDKLKDDSQDHKQELAVENVKEQVRGILGINELFEIRSFIIERSVRFTKALGQ